MKFHQIKAALARALVLFSLPSLLLNSVNSYPHVKMEKMLAQTGEVIRTRLQPSE